MPTRQEMLDKAKVAYNNLKECFAPHSRAPLSYWQIGNCFDSMTDYLLLVQFLDAELIQWAEAKYYDPAVQKGACWYDDYAWWAIASTKAYEPRFVPIFGHSTNSFKRIAEECWVLMDQGKGDKIHLGAPRAYTNRDNTAGWISPPKPLEYWVTPRFDSGIGKAMHGVWQYDIFSIKRGGGDNWTGPAECSNDTNPSWPDPAKDPEKVFWGGFYQLTVVNALYLLLAVRREQARLAGSDIPSAAGQLADEYGFFRAWFGHDPGNPIESVLSLLEAFPPGAELLIRERVSTYAKLSDGTYPMVQHWDPQTSWAGDQGLILNALTGYLLMRGGDAALAKLIRQLIDGYRLHMMDEGTPWSYYPAADYNKLERWDAGDYECGIGVFMRGLLQAYQPDNSPIREIAKEADFRKFLGDSAAWAVDETPESPFQHLNVLATLTAALTILT
jgi:hypothetical protein